MPGLNNLYLLHLLGGQYKTQEYFKFQLVVFWKMQWYEFKLWNLVLVCLWLWILKGDFLPLFIAIVCISKFPCSALTWEHNPLESQLYAGKESFGASQVKNLPASAGAAGAMGSILALGRFPGEGNGNPLQHSCLENPMDRGAWRAAVHGVTKDQTWLSMCAQSPLLTSHLEWSLGYFLLFL